MNNIEHCQVAKRCAPHQHLTCQENCLNPDIQYQGSIKLLKFFCQEKKKVLIIDFGEGSRLIQFTAFEDMDTKLARSSLSTLT